MKANWRGAGLWSLLAGLAILLGTASAPAAAETSVRMSLRGSHHYRIKIESFATGLIQLQAAKILPGGESYATYRAHGHVTAKRINVNFGRVGRVSATFHSFKQLSRGGAISGGCRGRRSIHQVGKFVGTIRFQGEQGFSSVSATKARGSMLRSCPVESRAAQASTTPASRDQSSPEFFHTSLTAVTKANNRSIVFVSETTAPLQPNGQQGHPQSLVQAELEEDRGRIEIERAIIVDPGSEPITVSPLGVTPVTAALTLPSPFRGTGSYRDEAGVPRSWTGDLTVDLPGARDVPLDGPDFTAILCNGKSTNNKLRRCEKEANALLVALQED